MGVIVAVIAIAVWLSAEFGIASTIAGVIVGAGVAGLAYSFISEVFSEVTRICSLLIFSVIALIILMTSELSMTFSSFLWGVILSGVPFLIYSIIKISNRSSYTSSGGSTHERRMKNSESYRKLYRDVKKRF